MLRKGIIAYPLLEFCRRCANGVVVTFAAGTSHHQGWRHLCREVGHGASCTRGFAPICSRGYAPVCTRGFAPGYGLFGPTGLTPPRCHVPTIAHQRTHAYGCRDTTALHDVRADADADACDASLHNKYDKGQRGTYSISRYKKSIKNTLIMLPENIKKSLKNLGSLLWISSEW